MVSCHLGFERAPPPWRVRGGSLINYDLHPTRDDECIHSLRWLAAISFGQGQLARGQNTVIGRELVV